MIPLFEAVSPLDFRYYGRNKGIKDALAPYLSEDGFIRYLAKVESALTATLSEYGLCSKKIAKEVAGASQKVSAQEVYLEEDRIHHNIRALANAIRKKVSDEAKPYVHFTSTSHDIICSADAARFKDASLEVLLPALVRLEKTLIGLALREKSTLQIGRTHGQHAEPITFGFAISQYVSRIGERSIFLKKAANNLRGKMAGAVGSYNASSLFFSDPEEFERRVLEKVGIKPSPVSTQVVQAEYMTDFIHAIVSCLGVLANLADDMRHLQRSEIAEVGEFFEAKQVGSSTMPHKRNPINFENVKSMWKTFMPRMMTQYMDQICEHQRDLTNSASSRFLTEIIAGLYISIVRLDKTMAKLVVDKEHMDWNFSSSKEKIAAEPAYLLLAASGHPDAHEYVRELTLKSEKTSTSFPKLLFEDETLKPYLKKLTQKQRDIIRNPAQYTGIASKKVEKICGFWKKEFGF
ncbi:adenylosuccinate lyase [Candidatus Woesearchaeota archaeon]|nr:adenylosuccinate lyase [Candidatus Woesearchaeota archaeon]